MKKNGGSLMVERNNNKGVLKEANATECKHLWITAWVTKDIAYKRECLLCKKKQTIDYLGGSMWRWVND